MKELHEFVPFWEVFEKEFMPLEPVDFHDVVQWLKNLPNPQPDLIARWEGYLYKSIIQRKYGDYSEAALEQRWQDHKAREEYLNGPFQDFEGEVVQCWKNCFAKYCGDERESESKSDMEEEDIDLDEMEDEF
ncbi:hypothetical protein B0H11DRAFT_1912089 [Mycena galericulata]|nr:hypothetical protein B0H11DRAFT_1912089 [Mycena galericulata]